MSGQSDRLELLETFIKIADAGGVGAAARALDASQSTVTRRLQQLEAALSAKLIERGVHGASLTPAGATLLPEAREMTLRWRGLTDKLDVESDRAVGLVRVAMSSAIASTIGPSIVAAFLTEHPQATVDLRVSDGVVDLGGEGVDFAVRLGKSAIDKSVAEGATVKRIATAKRVLLASPALADRLAMDLGVMVERCEPLALEGAPFVGLSADAAEAMSFTGRGGEREEGRFERIATVDDWPALARLARAGVGVTAAPRWFLHDAPGALTHLARDWVAEELPVSLVWRADRFRSAAASALMARLQSALPALIEGG